MSNVLMHRYDPPYRFTGRHNEVRSISVVMLRVMVCMCSDGAALFANVRACTCVRAITQSSRLRIT